MTNSGAFESMPPLSPFSQIEQQQQATCAIGCMQGSPHSQAQREFNLQVLVRDNDVDRALRVLKKKMQREGVFREMKQRRSYEKPSETKTRERAEAIRRTRKLARKQAIREGLLPSPPKKMLPDRKPPLPQITSRERATALLRSRDVYPGNIVVIDLLQVSWTPCDATKEQIKNQRTSERGRHCEILVEKPDLSVAS